MNKIKYILLLVIGFVLTNSCEEVENEVNEISNASNLAAFESNSTTVTQIADGVEYSVSVMVKLTGPSTVNVTEDLTLTFAAGDSSTAVEDVHYRFDESSIVLTADNNYLGFYTFTMLTEGIVTPLKESPVLDLKVSAVSGNSSVIATGKANEITLNFACPSELQGTYDVETKFTDTDGTVSNLTWSEEIAKEGVGEYRTTRVGHWTVAQLLGTAGFTFYDVCDVITIPGQNLVDLYSNWVEGTSASVDPATGVITMEYSICFGGACRYYESTYTPN